MGAAEALGGSLHDHLEHAVGIGVQLSVPNPQNRPSFAGEECIAPNVAIGFHMLAPIEFDDKFRLPAREVGKVRADRELAGQFWTQARDQMPEHEFMPGCVGAQGSRSLSSAAALGLERPRRRILPSLERREVSWLNVGRKLPLAR